MKNIICYSCNNLNNCSVFRELKNMSSNFSINECKDYNEVNRYRKIAEHDDLMRLIYDYFTDQLIGVSKADAREAIESQMLYL